MATQRFCRACGQWHHLDDWPSACIPAAPQGQSTVLPVPMFISDTTEPTEHVDGRFYTSKSRFRQVTKAHGCIEVGNDPARLRKRGKPKADSQANADALKRAEYLVANNIPLSAVMK